MSLSRYWSTESLWAWMGTLILYTLLLLLLLHLTQRRHSRTSTKPVFMASALPPAMEACSIAAWHVGLRIQPTPMWWTSLIALPSDCRGHRASRPAICIPVLLSTVSPASVWFVPYSRGLKFNINNNHWCDIEAFICLEYRLIYLWSLCKINLEIIFNFFKSCCKIDKILISRSVLCDLWGRPADKGGDLCGAWR